jgi:OOP family OmpA-OmpF porin
MRLRKSYTAYEKAIDKSVLLQVVSDHPELLSGQPVVTDYVATSDKMTTVIGNKSYHIEFESGSSTILPISKSIIDDIIQASNLNNGTRIEINGYTDSQGDHDYNVQLSQSRADAVKTAITARGIQPSRITANGYGPDSPVAPNTTNEGRAKNRRVEVLFYSE